MTPEEEQAMRQRYRRMLAHQQAVIDRLEAENRSLRLDVEVLSDRVDHVLNGGVL
jgi:hypothetical protein